ncbi:MAG: FAD-dependent oxidoreductase [Acidimicrobiia bacterium]|nr:FAD-dependent oxidoreductase [Acidimicrobiia bacterium]
MTVEIVVIGGGAGGLLTSLLLARDGHDVTVLERDEQPPPATNDDAWDSWTRAGVSQMRQPHGFIGKTRAVLVEELPDVWARIQESDTYTVDLTRFAPDQDAATEEDRRRLRVEVMRRTTFDRLMARAADAEPNLEVRRGVAVSGLTAADADATGVRTVRGVTTDAGEIEADLVIDSGGRRSAAPRWLDALGAPVEQWSESDGFTYHSLWFRTHDGRYPENVAAFFGGMAPGLLTLIFPGDAGVFGLAMVGLGSDKILRRLRDPEIYTAVARRLSPIAHWVDPAVAAPITDVIPMGAIQNRRLRFWNGEGPSAFGFVNVGDSVLSTNPSLGRGIALAAVGALELRSVLRQTDQPREIAVEFDRVKEERLTPWLWDAVASDQGMRRALNEALGNPTNGDISDRTRLARASMMDMDCWRRWNGVNQAFDLPSSCLDDPELMSRAHELTEDMPPPSYNLSRDELVDILG